MNFGFTEEQDHLRKTVRDVLAERSPMKRVRQVMEDAGATHDAPLWQSMAELGWLGLALPEAHGGAALTEFTLLNGRRADVISIDGEGRVTIVEIKTSVADYRSDNKWPEYLDFCDYFYFAVPEDFPRELLPSDCGIMVADAYEALILVPAEAQPVNGSRRRALVLRFARLAAQRLTALTDPRE